MFLSPKSARRFIDGYSAVLIEVLRQSGKASSGKVIQDLAAARSIEQEKPSKLEKAILSLSEKGTPIAEDLLSAIRSRQLKQWVFLRNTTRHAIFVDSQSEHAYAVLGLTGTIDQIVGGESVLFKAAVFEFEGHYVCDGIAEGVLFLGKNLRAEVNQSLAAIKKAGRFHAKPAA